MHQHTKANTHYVCIDAKGTGPSTHQRAARAPPGTPGCCRCAPPSPATRGRAPRRPRWRAAWRRRTARHASWRPRGRTGRLRYRRYNGDGKWGAGLAAESRRYACKREVVSATAAESGSAATPSSTHAHTAHAAATMCLRGGAAVHCGADAEQLGSLSAASCYPGRASPQPHSVSKEHNRQRPPAV